MVKQNGISTIPCVWFSNLACNICKKDPCSKLYSSGFLFQAMLQYLDKLQREDMEDLIKKRETQRALMKDVAKANEVCENLVKCVRM